MLTEKTKQLQMIWPEDKDITQPTLPKEYHLCNFQPEDKAAFFQLMDMAGFEGWDDEKLEPWLPRVLPNGWFLIFHQATQELVATAMATHRPAAMHPSGGEVGWVAAHPQHRGNSLGLAVCSAVMCRYRETGYQRIYLQTDDHRLAALKTYLKMGFVPFLFEEVMTDRWKIICQHLNWPFTPENWP